ncbi:hypothetical protein BN1723_021002 [Verticillium longisporum]|uniref:Uncharacterized protein n=1 Tax=Verticillium longisporum TaxID=100787 RepID=A0A0G4KS25_VERLO|nr:hypothetical protein BN1723_021002 [Verticillium longisporum]
MVRVTAEGVAEEAHRTLHSPSS